MPAFASMTKGTVRGAPGHIPITQPGCYAYN